MGFLVMLSNAVRQKPVIARAMASGLLLTLASCCIVPPLPPPPPPPFLPPDFNGKTDPENSAQLTVEEFYHDPVLLTLIAQALAGNQELQILEQDIQIASTVILGRTGAFLPFVSLKGKAGLDKHSLYTPLGAAEEQLTYPGEHHFPDPLPNFMVAADIFWRIDIWRELRNSRDAAVQRYLATIERRNYFVTQMVADIAENYFELMMLDQRLLILDQTIALQQRSLEFARASLAAGRGSALAVQRFLAEVRKNQSEKLVVGQEIIQTENRINFLLGRYPQRVERESANFMNRNLAFQVGVPAQLLLYRTDVRQAERELAAAGLDVLVARVRFLPRLDLDGTVGFEAFSPRYLFYPEALVADVAGQLVAPLVNRMAIKADYGNATASQLQTVFNYQRVILDAFTQVANNLAGAENYRRSVEIKQMQLTALQQSVEVASSLFQSDRADYIDVLFAQRDLLDARTVLVETKLRQLAAVVNAYQALGGGVVFSNTPLPPGGHYCPPPELAVENVPAPEVQTEQAPPPAPAEAEPRPGEAPKAMPQPGEAPKAEPQPGEAPKAEPQPENAPPTKPKMVEVPPTEGPQPGGSLPVFRPDAKPELTPRSEPQPGEAPPLLSPPPPPPPLLSDEPAGHEGTSS